jgi:cytochrome c-type biogenesis protein CcmE
VAARDARRGRRRVLAALGVAIALGGVIALAAGGIGENLVYYWGPTELHAAGDKAVGATIRLGGLVRPGSIVRHAGSSLLEFDVVDRPGQVVRVRTRSVPPQMFRESIGVVVEGTMTRDGVFESNRLMVSHGNEYKPPATAAEADAKRLMRTTEGLEQPDGARKP